MKEPSGLVAALFAVAGGCLAYVLCEQMTVPSFWYLPVSRTWVFGAKPEALAMSWYGRTLYIFVTAGVFALLGTFQARFTRHRSALTTYMAAALAAVSLLAAVSICVIANVDRPTKPLPIPNGQQIVCTPAPDAPTTHGARTAR